MIRAMCVMCELPERTTNKMYKLISSLSRKQKSYVFLIIDLVLIPLALFFACSIQTLPIPASEAMLLTLPILPYLLVIGAGLSMWLGIPQIVLNDFERHAIGLTGLFTLLLTASAAGLSELGGIGLPLGTYVMFGASYFLFSVTSRGVLYQVVSAIYRTARPRKVVLIYGAGKTGTQLAQALKAHDSIDPVAFVDDNSSLQGITLSGLPVYAPARLAEIVEKRKIRRVLLAMPSLSPPKQAQIARRMQDMGLEVQALPSFAQLIGEEALVDKLAPVVAQDFLGRDSRDVPLGDAFGSYMGRSILISGAGGSIGSELCRQVLACRPTRLVLFELSELALYTIEQELRQLIGPSPVEIVPVLGSVTDVRQVRTVLARYEVELVLHAAAYKHVPLVEANPLSGLANNVIGTQTLAQEAAAAGVERFILISSDKAVRPTNVMGASKRLAELVVQDLATRQQPNPSLNRPGTVFSMVRFGNVLGSSGSVVPLFQDQIQRGGPITVTDLEVTRFFMTIREAVKLVLKAGAAATGGEVFVLDMGEPVSIMRLAQQMIESAGYTLRDAAHPDGDIEIEIIGLRPGEKICEELTLTDDLIGTKYQKIFCAREGRLSELEMASVMRGLRAALAACDEDAARTVIQCWVEGYQQGDPDRKTC